ncbi:MAG: hypothetical protein GY858_07425, partial [Candidatus Omnitrophica bacterium]|nr:hypothetical protein [Candidatus Omnitrophota bacterium]
IPPTAYAHLTKANIDDCVELITYHYLSLDKSRAIPVMIGFCDELERDFFEKFISVSGIGPKAALRAFDKPIPLIAKAIESGDLTFLKTLAGIGAQKAKQIVAHLQGKVGRFALIKDEPAITPQRNEIVEEAKQVLKRLQYNPKEAEDMVKRAYEAKPDIDNISDFLNEIYRQRKVI